MWIPSLKNIGIAAALIFLRTASAQSGSLLILQIAGVSDTGSPIFAHPFLGSLAKDCIRLNFGLPVFRGEREIGIFMKNCPGTPRDPALEFKLYPNPVHDFAVLRVNKLIAGNPKLSIRLFNTAGQALQYISENAENIFKGIKLNVSSLPAGLYFMRITTPGSSHVIRFIKLK